MIQESITVDKAIDILQERQQKIDILKKHTAQRIAKIAAEDKRQVFDLLRKKVKEVAKSVSESPVTGDVEKDMSEVRSVRHEAESMFGKFQETEQEQQKINSSQLNFLVGVQIKTSALPHTPKQVQGTVIHDLGDEQEPLEL